MNAEHLRTIITTAAATAAIALAGFWPAFLNGAGDGNAVTPGIKMPKFVSGSVEWTLALPEGRSFKTGDRPAFNLVAVNTADQPATAAVEAVMMTTATPSRMSRTPGRQTNAWHEPLNVVLEPHETKTFAMDTRTEIPGNSRINIYLHSADENSRGDAVLISLAAFSTADDAQTGR
jgi:hypothetical protein